MSLRAAGVALAGLAVAGCATPEPRDPLPLQEAAAFSRSGEAPPPDRWWTAFEDEELNGRVERALEGNFSLAAAWERLQEARAVERRERAGLSPRLDGVARADRFVLDGRDARSLVSVGLEASYELDLWGRIESAVEAERLRASATEADYRSAAITLSAEVALTWYELAVSRLQHELIESQLETNRTVLRVIESRFAVGQSGSADVLRQRQFVEASREQIIVVQALIQVLEHQLAVLEGRPAQESSVATTPSLPVLPPIPATGVPAELLRRRPDVRGALLRLHASDEEVAVAVSEQYPRIDLTASLETAADAPSRLFSDWLTSLGGQIVAPLLDGGSRRAEVERREAVRRQRLAEFGQTALVAFREVEDALALEAEQDRRIESLRRQLELAIRTYQQLRTQYLNGAADFLDVLIALSERQQIERSLLTASLDRVSFRIALYRALAGGFDTPREGPETKAESREFAGKSGGRSSG